MFSYRKPTEKESAKLDAARKKTQEGIEGEKDIFSKVSTTAAKSARDDVKAGLKMRESVPASAREGEAYEQSGYKKGGKIMNKKTKCYDEGGEIEFETKVGQSQSKSIDNETRRKAMEMIDLDVDAEPRITKDAPKAKAPSPKAESKAEPKAEKVSSMQQAKDVIKGKDVSVSAPKSFSQAGGNTKASSKKEDLSGFSFNNVAKKLREKAGITSYKSGGKVSQLSKANGIAQRGKTRGKIC
jgi:SLT domain-containing protein